MTEPTPPAPATAVEREAPASTRFKLPRFVTGPIEAVLSSIGGFTSGATEWVSSRGTRATSRARPWLEFIDLSAFGPAEGGISAYIDRLKINGPYFIFNYVMVGLAFTVFSVVTKPLALLGALLLVWIYFQFFGSESSDAEYQVMGFSLDNSEKIGLMVFLGFIVFWFTAGGFGIFFSVLTAVLFVTLIHGTFRKPSPDAIPIV